jgi:hypothetical protein
MITQEDELQTTEPLTLEDRRAFMRLPIEERRRILALQAEKAAELYETQPEAAERGRWQSGDIVEY